jgi:heme-degrading monooxygenase HmoA
VAPMLYLPGVDIYPPQINDGYSYRKGGDAEGLFRSGFWNSELSHRWMDEADFIIVEEWRYLDNWKQFVESGDFQELERTNDLNYCTKNTGLRIFRRER